CTLLVARPVDVPEKLASLDLLADLHHRLHVVVELPFAVRVGHEALIAGAPWSEAGTDTGRAGGVGPHAANRARESGIDGDADLPRRGWANVETGVPSVGLAVLRSGAPIGAPPLHGADHLAHGGLLSVGGLASRVGGGDERLPAPGCPQLGRAILSGPLLVLLHGATAEGMLLPEDLDNLCGVGERLLVVAVGVDTDLDTDGRGVAGGIPGVPALHGVREGADRFLVVDGDVPARLPDIAGRLKVRMRLRVGTARRVRRLVDGDRRARIAFAAGLRS